MESVIQHMIPFRLSLRSRWACSLNGYSTNSPERYSYAKRQFHKTAIFIEFVRNMRQLFLTLPERPESVL